MRELENAGVHHAYADYWTAWSLTAASRGNISSVGLGYRSKLGTMGPQTIGFSDVLYDRECHVYAFPARKRNPRSFDPEANRKAAIKTFGAPVKTVTIGDDYEVMYFNNNIAVGRPPLPKK